MFLKKMGSPKHKFWDIVKIFFFWRAGLLLLTYLGSQIFPLVANGGLGAIGPGKSFDFWASWAQWDGGHYYNIAKFGYFTPTEYAFFPFYPLLVRILGFIFSGNFLIWGLLISNTAFLLFLYVFYKFTAEIKGTKVAQASTITLLAFPTAYFAVAMYSESIFLLTTALFFSMLSTKKYLRSAFLAGIACATRLVGLALALSLLVDFAKEKKEPFGQISKKILFLAISILPFSLYSLYLYQKTKNPLYFLTVQTTWHRSITDPLATVYSYLATLFSNKPFNDYLDVFLTLLFLIVLFLGRKKIPPALWLFSLLAIIIPASSGTLTSMPRYLLSSLGVFIIAGEYLAATNFKFLIWGVSLLGQITLAIMFVNGHWTA